MIIDNCTEWKKVFEQESRDLHRLVTWKHSKLSLFRIISCFHNSFCIKIYITSPVWFGANMQLWRPILTPKFKTMYNTLLAKCPPHPKYHVYPLHLKGFASIRNDCNSHALLCDRVKWMWGVWTMNGELTQRDFFLIKSQCPDNNNNASWF